MEQRPQGMSNEDVEMADEEYAETEVGSDGENQENHRPQPVLLSTMVKRPNNTKRHITPIDIDEADLALAEEGFPAEELIPPSSFEQQSTPPRPQRTIRAPAPPDPVAAAAEFNDIPMHDIFSSPTSTPVRLPRVQGSMERSAKAGPGPSSSASRPQPARKIVIEKQHSWSKEVDQKRRQIFKLPRFREHQKEAIDETMAGKDGRSDY
jgi:bloom syndrome protein